MASTPNEASSSTPRQTKTRHARKLTVENWDDDFEYIGPSKPKVASIKSKKDEDSRSGAGRASPTGSDVSCWDDSPPQASTCISSRNVTNSRTLSKPSGGVHLGPPRHSPSHSPGLPSPISKARHRSLAAPPASAPPDMSRARSDSTGAAAARKLIRHPSASFLFNASPGRSTSSLSLVTGPNRSSPNLPRSPSSEAMPPPALPMMLNRKSSKGKPKIRSDGVRKSGIPFSPSQEAMREMERRPSLWKRLSGKGSSEMKGESAWQRSLNIRSLQKRSQQVDIVGKGAHPFVRLPPASLTHILRYHPCR
jgi:hypothetical protein